MHGRKGFTLIELLVVILIIGIMVGLLLPMLSGAMARARSVGCLANLKSIGTVFELYLEDHDRTYPVARYMPAPFLTTFSSRPTIPEVLDTYLESGAGESKEVFKCPADSEVYPLAEMSYGYSTFVGGRREEAFASFIPASRLPIMSDFDNADDAELQDGTTMDIGFFHLDRNFLFADFHVASELPDP